LPLLRHKQLLAIAAVTIVAIETGVRPASRDDICLPLRVAHRYLEPILQALSRARIIVGRRGRTGGYQLGRKPSLVSVADILQAISSTNDNNDLDGPTSEAIDFVIEALRPAEADFLQLLRGVTIDALIEGTKGKDLYGPGGP
jgi:Rrf2 family transcriptional regulator, iron-sulfur cluster assembly transcription factor